MRPCTSRSLRFWAREERYEEETKAFDRGALSASTFDGGDDDVVGISWAS